VSDQRRLLILAEGYSGDAHFGKTARGVIRYRPEDVVALLDSTRAGQAQDGLPIVASVADALALRPTVALVGVATQGGRFPPAWRQLLKDCIAAGLDIESGLHDFLGDDPELAAAAGRRGVEIRDLRRSPEDLNVPTGANLTVDAHVVATVGSDCSLGKMTVCLELDLEARRRGLASAFVPTGQTGIAIAGWGTAVDEVVSDFVAGASEQLVLEGRRRAGAGALLWIEGQGAISHPSYSGVTPAARIGAPRADPGARAGPHPPGHGRRAADRPASPADRRLPADGPLRAAGSGGGGLAQDQPAVGRRGRRRDRIRGGRDRAAGR
jgi:uncharacterized NAD-dependent epimerase/dehydratase family protein